MVEPDTRIVSASGDWSFRWTRGLYPRLEIGHFAGHADCIRVFVPHRKASGPKKFGGILMFCPCPGEGSQDSRARTRMKDTVLAYFFGQRPRQDTMASMMSHPIFILLCTAAKLNRSIGAGAV